MRPMPHCLLSPFAASIVDCTEAGVLFDGAGTTGRLEGADVAGNKGAGVHVQNQANPLVISCR